MKSLARRPILILIALGLLCLVLLGRIPSGAQWAVVLGNAAHGPVFAVIAAIALALMHDARERLLRNALTSFVLAVSIGVLIELLQSRLGRDAEFKDVVTDAVGALAGLSLFVFIKGLRRSASYSRALTGAALLGFVTTSALIVAPLAQSAVAYLARNQRDPVLMDANALLGTYFITAYDGIAADLAPLPAGLQATPQPSMGLRVRPGVVFPWGLGLSEIRHDWRTQRNFAVQLANATDTPLRLQLRIYDAQQRPRRQEGFYSPVIVAPHSTAIHKIPLPELRSAQGKRHVDLASVDGVVLYGASHEDAREFYLLKMWLE